MPVTATSALQRLLATATLAAFIAGCGTTARTQTTAINVSSGSCAALSPPEQFARAKPVVVGSWFAGATARTRNTTALLSPARFRVSRYLKGSGSRIVRVQTAIQRARRGIEISEDGIAPRASQRWKLFLAGAATAYATSTCAGSRLMTPAS